MQMESNFLTSSFFILDMTASPRDKSAQYLEFMVENTEHFLRSLDYTAQECETCGF